MASHSKLPENESAPPVHACPACGERGKRVARLTMEHLLLPQLVSQIGRAPYYFCETATCPVVYFPFAAAAAIFHKPDLQVRVGLKEDDDPIPICYCFEITRKDIWDEIEQTGAATIPSRIKSEVQAGNCACEVKNPSGKCCLGNVTRAVQQGLKTISLMETAKSGD